ncbi:MAG: hypothetical protein RBS73_15745 [Prolixibacteraceae bacterium]|jgi:multidrug transporter EmrE-like cation transporter|nr:hypothetical protein [Prolixibacteraceae bacterium]
MIYLILSILFSTLIFLTFKISERFKFSLVKLIVINYIVAASLGYTFYSGTYSPGSIVSASWFSFASLLGFLFIIFFFLIGKSIQIAGIAVTTIASKMSVAIPILFSILYFSEETNFLKITGLIAAFFALLLCIYKPEKKTMVPARLFLPVLIFIGTGIADSLIKYNQHQHVKNNEALLFSSTVFAVALVPGLLYSFIFERKFAGYANIPTLLGGIVLGVSNFGSLFFLMKTLEKSTFDSSVVFGINNLCIVALSVITGYFIFSEKMNRINWTGVVLAILAIVLLTGF